LNTIDAKTGDVVVVEPGKAHKFENKGGRSAAMRVRVTPALQMELLLETAAGLAQEGRVTKKGMPKPLDLALFVKEFGGLPVPSLALRLKPGAAWRAVTASWRCSRRLECLAGLARRRVHPAAVCGQPCGRLPT
jgi:hypothetical protein